MLMTAVSVGYAEEVSVIPNELAGISSFAEDVDPDSADTDMGQSFFLCDTPAAYSAA